MNIADMRALLGLGPEISDVEVITRYGAYERASAAVAALETDADDPFATALEAIFASPGAKTAVYDDGENDLREIRVILSKTIADRQYSRVAVVRPALSVEIQRSDVPEPVAGAIIIVGARLRDGVPTAGDEYVLTGDPIGDVEGLSFTFTIEARP